MYAIRSYYDLPLSRLLNLYVKARPRRSKVIEQFLGAHSERVPYVISIAGSVAVGKSTTARILQALLDRWPEHPKVELVTTDGFLHPNRVLEERGLMKKKGFPQSYDMHRLVSFIADIKAGKERVSAPIYSHHIYDIVPDSDRITSYNVCYTKLLRCPTRSSCAPRAASCRSTSLPMSAARSS